MSPPPVQSMGELFSEESFAWGNKRFWENFLGDVFGTNDQIRLMVKRFQRSSKVSLFSHWPWSGLFIYSLKRLLFFDTTNRGFNLKNTFCILCLWSWGFHVKSVLFFKKFIVVTYSAMSWLYGRFRFTYLRARFMEKWVKALHSESEGSWLKPRLK